MAFKIRVKGPGAKPWSKGTQRDRAHKWRLQPRSGAQKGTTFRAKVKLAGSGVGGGQDLWEEPSQSTIL